MPVLRINATGAGLQFHDQSLGGLRGLAARLTGSGPIVIMVHGFKFAPGIGAHCPHGHILAERDGHGCRKALSWPRALGLAAPGGGLGIAFGWSARGTLWQAYASADAAGLALAALIGRLRRIAPHRPVRTIAHSMGARVVLAALPHLTAGDVDRLVLLAPAEFEGTAAARIDTAAGRAARVLTVTSGENLVFDRLLETCLGRPVGARAMGRARRPLPGTLRLRLDDPASLAALARSGWPVALPDRRVCHWSSYLRPGVFDLYRAILTETGDHALTRLRDALPQGAQAPSPSTIRWPRLAALPLDGLRPGP